MSQDPITTDHIERLGRALLAALAPITGARARGEVLVTAAPDAALELPVNTYLLPVVGGQMRDDLPFKTTAPASIGAGESVAVPVTSNIGGARHNVPAGTVFRFRPKLAGAVDEALATDAFAGGSDEGALIRTAVVYEDIEEAGPSRDIFAAKIADSPALVLAWSSSEPVDGASAGLGTKSTRAGRGKQFWRETFVLYVRAGHLGSDHDRRREGQVIVQAVTALLTDRKLNLDGEVLATVGGGVEITQRVKLGRSTTHYLYGLRLRATQTVERADSRTFARWLTTRIEGPLDAGDEGDPLPLVDVTVDMP